MFYGSPSSYSWKDSCGVSHTIRQGEGGEGGEQGDALMPLLFALGQHRPLVVIQPVLQDGEFLFAYLDDIYAVVPPNRIGAVYVSMQQHLYWQDAGVEQGRRQTPSLRRVGTYRCGSRPRRFWSGFLRCRICSQRGHCWFTALRREQIISCGLSSHSV